MRWTNCRWGVLPSFTSTGKWPAVRWKLSRASAGFAPVLKFFSGKLPIRAITLPMIREYRQQRRQHISKNMKQPVTGRTVNYEMHLLRGMMIFADCWTDSLAARYTRCGTSRSAPVKSRKKCN